jgi:hypothetical protein
MLQPLEQFICDSCNQPIESIENGWVEWESFPDDEQEKDVTKNFRICHKDLRCQKFAKSPYCSDSPLRDFTGDMAILQTTAMLDPGQYHSPTYYGPEPQNMREFTDFLRRLTIPYYDEARLYWKQAIEDGYFQGENEISIYMPRNLRAMIEHYEQQINNP